MWARDVCNVLVVQLKRFSDACFPPILSWSCFHRFLLPGILNLRLLGYIVIPARFSVRIFASESRTVEVCYVLLRAGVHLVKVRAGGGGNDSSGNEVI